MRAILLSVQPKWLEKILNGEKTIEIRKNAPRELLRERDIFDNFEDEENDGIEVYLYCTKSYKSLRRWDKQFCDNRSFYITDHNKTSLIPSDIWNGKIVAKFTLREVVEIGHIVEGVALDENYEYSLNGDSSLSIADYLKRAALTVYDALNYKNDSKLYAWHITDLMVFDEPMELGEFKYYRKERVGNANLNCYITTLTEITRPPQSYMYVEVDND